MSSGIRVTYGLGGVRLWADNEGDKIAEILLSPTQAVELAGLLIDAASHFSSSERIAIDNREPYAETARREIERQEKLDGN